MKIIFFYPSLKIGGAQLLFIRCARELSYLKKFEIVYIDYIEGFAKNILKNFNVDIIIYSKEIKTYLPDNSIIILPLLFIDQINLLFEFNSNNVKFLFWSIQPESFTHKITWHNKITLLPWTKTKIKISLKKLHTNGNLKFMDYNNYYPLHQKLNLNLSKIEYLPVPIDDSEIISPNEISTKKDFNTLSFLWLSRLDYDKTNTLISIMNELEIISYKYQVTLYICGTGNNEISVRKIANNYEYNIDFIGLKYGNKLNNFIDNNVDIGIAMGTSILEIAKRGKPVIVQGILKNIHKAKELNNYILLHESNGYSLASPDNVTSEMGSFISKVNQIVNNYDESAKDSYNYVINNHLLSYTVKKLKRSIDYVLKQNNCNDIIFDIEYILNNNLSKIIQRTYNNTIRLCKAYNKQID